MVTFAGGVMYIANVYNDLPIVMAMTTNGVMTPDNRLIANAPTTNDNEYSADEASPAMTNYYLFVIF